MIIEYILRFPKADYLVKFRLQWGKPDTLSLLRSSLDLPVVNGRDSHMRVLSNGDIQTLQLGTVTTTVKAATNDSKLPAVIADGIICSGFQIGRAHV